MNGWYGCDLDGCLAYYDGWKGPTHIGPPIPRMATRIMDHLDRNEEVRIFTARVATPDQAERELVVKAIEDWCREHLGQVLTVTCTKDYRMVLLYDDRCVQIIPNTGVRADGHLAPDISFPIPQDRIVPAMVDIANEILRVENVLQGLKILRSRVVGECRHLSRYPAHNSFHDELCWKCDTYNANLGLRLEGDDEQS